jgi:arabinofuranan 3-O-arabinosyltransferase
MVRVRKDAGVTLGFTALAFAVAFWQLPGWATSDTKIDLYADPGRFLSSVASVWTNTGDLGEIHSSQYGGYLWPMGPFFALCHAIGLSPWVAERLWLGLILALAAWGILRLLDVLIGAPRGVAHVVAAAVFTFNPYTVVFTARTSITLLGYAALPWLLLIVHRGLRVEPGAGRLRSWWWPAAFALIFTSAGGGVNAALVAFVLLGPAALLIYEPAMGHVPWRAARAFVLRAALLSLLVSLWWLMDLLVQARYGINFLQYTEQPRTIWGTNSITESLRLMGYWTSYLGAGYPQARFGYYSDSGTLLYNVAVVGASLIVPALACLGFVWTRRLRYGPFFLAMVLLGVVVMSAGFPNGTPLRQVMNWVYYHVSLLSFLRTVDKAAPVVALGIAGLLGLAADVAWARMRTSRILTGGGWQRAVLVAAPAALAALIALAAWPLFQGKAIDRQLTWKQIPAAWREAGRNLDAHLPANTRAVVLPGQVFAFYKWGGTIDSILPRLTDKPVAVRYETPYSDLHADDLLLTIDNLVQQGRLYGGQLKPLLGLIGAASVISGTDDDTTRSGAVDPSSAARALAGQGLGAPRNYGPLKTVPAAPGSIDPPQQLAQVRQFNLSPGRGIVHVDQGPPTVLDGSAQGLADLAAFGQLPAHAPIFYAGDLSSHAIRSDAAAGANIVITDSNRRQVFSPQFTQQDFGPVLTAGQPITADEATLNPFAAKGTAAQTVTLIRGAAALEAPSIYGLNQFPELGPLAAFDGNLNTSWVPYPNLPPAQRWVQIDFSRPRDVPYIDVYPLVGPQTTVKSVAIDGRIVPVSPAGTRISLHAHAISSLRIALARVVRLNSNSGPGGLREVRIPGVHVSAVLRPPLLASSALAGRDLTHTSLTWLFARQTADDPLRANRYVNEPVQNDPADAQDPEPLIARQIASPAARAYTADARVTPGVNASDSAFDALAGVHASAAFTSSSRFENEPRYRASGAFDADPATAWVGLWIRPFDPAPWIAWRTRRPLTVSRLQLTPARQPVRRPTQVSLSWPGGTSPPLTVGPGGAVVLPRAVRADAFRLTVLRAQFPAGLSASERAGRTVGIGTLSVPGLAPVSVPHAGAVRSACGAAALSVGGARVPLRVTGSIGALDAGLALSATACAGPVTMAAGTQEVGSLPGSFSVDLLRLHSPAPAPLPAPASASGGRLLSAGRLGNDSVSGVRVDLTRAAWLVLGESYDTGWQARCDGRSLGAPQLIDGYANGWVAPAGCRNVSFAFSPQSTVNLGYVVSGVVALVLLLLLIVVRPPRIGARALVRPLWHAGALDGARRRLPLPRAAALAVVLGAVLGFVFAKRAGIVIAVGLFVIFWRGYGPRALAAAAGALLLVAVPIAYLIGDPRNQGGYNFNYSVELIDAHWLGVAAVIMLGLAGWMTLSAARHRARRPGPPGPPEHPEIDAAGPPAGAPVGTAR